MIIDFKDLHFKPRTPWVNRPIFYETACLGSAYVTDSHMGSVSVLFSIPCAICLGLPRQFITQCVARVKRYINRILPGQPRQQLQVIEGKRVFDMPCPGRPQADPGQLPGSMRVSIMSAGPSSEIFSCGYGRRGLHELLNFFPVGKMET